MAATLAGAFKAYIEQGGLGLAVYRDGRPTVGVVPWPHVVVQDGIASADLMHGDYDDHDAEQAVLETVQLDLFQQARRIASPTHAPSTEQYPLPRRLARMLRGTGIQPYAPVHIHGTRIVNAMRWPIADNVLRHTWTVNVYGTDQEVLTP